jgi:hypothetical protein
MPQVYQFRDKSEPTDFGTVALEALEFGVPDQLRAKSAHLRLPPAKYCARARSQICFSDPKFRYRPRPSANCLLNPMGKLDAGQCYARTPEGLEASHRGASAFDRSMILFNQIVEVSATSHLNELPLRILAPHKPKGQVTLLKAIAQPVGHVPADAQLDDLGIEPVTSVNGISRSLGTSWTLELYDIAP